ncbi:MAG TPA: glycosyltransferase family 2 protein [Chthoniobacteraceae bacterium]|jgi:GT2 family glycosyltransferase|nr:glycosyltransferase family 2 protein [Chthoniobacteraceae bacterium]
MSAPTAPLVLAIPTFRAERFLAATLDSLAAQGPHIRWRLQDAASPDETVAIARRHQRAGDVVVSEPDAGQADGLNRAFRAMGGEIVGFINGDDCLLPGAAERVLQCFAEHPGIDLVVGGIEWIDEQGAVTGTHAGSIANTAEVLDLYGVWWNRRQWVQPEVFYRRALWERVGGFDPRYQLAFDYDFWVRCFLAGARVLHLPQAFAQFRFHATQKSSASAQAADEIRDIAARHLPSAGLPAARRRSLQARLSYDRYQVADPAGRAPFWRALLTHPEWLGVPEVRARVQTSCRGRLPRAKASAQ